MICDHYVINKKNSNFIYAAIKESKGMAIKRSYLHDFIFPKYPDFHASVSSTAYQYYKRWIYKPITDQRH